jgi:phage terminase large subunit-like protein
LSRGEHNIVWIETCCRIPEGPDVGKPVLLSADATTAYGLSPALTIHDELGQVKGPRSELYEALETATAAQEEPLSIVISTQAPTDCRPFVHPDR